MFSPVLALVDVEDAGDVAAVGGVVVVMVVNTWLAHSHMHKGV